jgi:hypothetical protein
LVSMKLACLALPWGIQYRSRQTPWTNTLILQTYASPDHIMDYSHQMDYLWGPRRKHTTHRVLAVNDTWTHTHTHTHTHIIRSTVFKHCYHSTKLGYSPCCFNTLILHGAWGTWPTDSPTTSLEKVGLFALWWALHPSLWIPQKV